MQRRYPMSATFIDFQEIKATVGIADIIAQLELNLVHKGEQWRG